ncbi:MAG: 4Fe-4S dicluster domain-containing protein [Candidatus Natronoplasma sp.]
MAEEEEEKQEMVEIFVMGKRYKVPKGLTIMTALEYAGYKFVRGCGCRGGFCGACATVYRTEEDYKFKMDLACQTAVEDGMFLVQLPFVPAVREEYDLEEVNPEDNDNVMLDYYPEIARCVSCNTCTKACPQDIEVMDYVQAALRGDIERCAELSFDCIQCGLCSIRCPSDIKHYHLAQLARRITGKYLDKHSEELEKRVEEIEEGKYDEELEKMVEMEIEELKETYEERDIRERD